MPYIKSYADVISQDFASNFRATAKFSVFCHPGYHHAKLPNPRDVTVFYNEKYDVPTLPRQLVVEPNWNRTKLAYGICRSHKYKLKLPRILLFIRPEFIAL